MSQDDVHGDFAVTQSSGHDGRSREVKRYMKHVKVLSTEKPVVAEEASWVELKNIIGGMALTSGQIDWVLEQIDDALTK